MRYIRPFISAKKNYLILVFTLVYLTTFTFNSIWNSNFEFLYYTIALSVLIYLTIYFHYKLHLGFFILFNLSILGFFHLLGGNFYFTDGLRLYDWYLIPGFFKYDNLIHSYATFIGTLAFYSLLENSIGEPIQKRFSAFGSILLLMAMGMGAIVELIEFAAVIFFGAEERVGGYYNNAFDLYFNVLGASFAIIVIYYYIHRPKFIRKIDGQIEENN